MYEFIYKQRKIVALSDTHGCHRDITIPECDILLHLGDACEAGDITQLVDFFEWMVEQPAKYKLFISGNHDLPFELYPELSNQLIPSTVLYLQNNLIEIEGITIVGIEATPFMLYETEIGEPIDILISHGPPKGFPFENLGCNKLLGLIQDAKPKIVLYGHIHSPDLRVVESDGITFVNVSQ